MSKLLLDHHASTVWSPTQPKPQLQSFAAAIAVVVFNQAQVAVATISIGF